MGFPNSSYRMVVCFSCKIQPICIYIWNPARKNTLISTFFVVLNQRTIESGRYSYSSWSKHFDGFTNEIDVWHMTVITFREGSILYFFLCVSITGNDKTSSWDFTSRQKRFTGWLCSGSITQFPLYMTYSRKWLEKKKHELNQQTQNHHTRSNFTKLVNS